MFGRPQIPVVDNRAGQQDPDAAHQRAQHRKPPGPAVNRFHGRVKAHRPAPEQAGAFGCGATIDDLLDLAFAAETADCQDGRTVHRKQQHRAVEEDDRQGVEGVVEQVAMAQRQGGHPVEVREDAEGHRLRPAAHHDRTEKAADQIEPDGCGIGPGHMRAKSQLPCPPIGSGPPQKDGGGQHETDDQPPAAMSQRRDAQTVTRRRRFEREPEELTDELDGIPVDRGQHVEADDVECQRSEDQRRHAQSTEIDRPDLGIAQSTQKVNVKGLADALPVVTGQRDARLGRAGRLDRCEQILIFSHV